MTGLAAAETVPVTDAPDATLERQMITLAEAARRASVALAHADGDTRRRALEAGARQLRERATEVLAANERDVADAEARGTRANLIDRLKLDRDRLEGVAQGLDIVAALPDPVNQVIASWDRPNGLHIERVRVPLGVVGIIYESRPNVTADAGSLALKAGNAAILRGGSESVHSSRAIVDCLQAGLREAGLPAECVQLVPTQDRAAVGHMLAMRGLIDVIVPRGGRTLIERVMAEARMPVIGHLEGLCHVYVDKAADPERAKAIVLNSKMRRTSVCGAMETLLVDAAAKDLLRDLIAALVEAGCAVRGDEAAQAADPRVTPAEEIDWSTEYLDAIISVRVVDGLDGALAHINRYGSHHTDAIVTEDQATAEEFLARCDSAIVLHNASTQFADGGEFGMGAEIGISTDKFHARGPVGAEQLTSYNYRVRGTGQTRP